MKRFIIYPLLLVFTITSYSQLGGKRSKEPYKSSVDSYTYKIGDEIKVGFPSKGEMFQNVTIFEYQNTLQQINNTLDVITGKPAEISKVKAADKSLSQFKGQILFFQSIPPTNHILHNLELQLSFA